MKLIVVERAAAEVGRLAARRSALTVAVVADPEEAAARDLARSLGAARWTADRTACRRLDRSLTVQDLFT